MNGTTPHEIEQILSEQANRSPVKPCLRCLRFVLHEPEQSTVKIDEITNPHPAMFKFWRTDTRPASRLLWNTGVDAVAEKLIEVVKAQAATERAHSRVEIGVMEKFEG